MDLITIKDGLLLSPINGLYGEKGDVLIKDGKIDQVGSAIKPQGTVISAAGCYVTPGFIDIHTHCYPAVPLGINPDTLGIQRGTTTILDAGSSGADNFGDFYENTIKHAQTKVFALLNIAAEGLIRGHELNDLAKINVEACKACVNAHRDVIVGLKARASGSVVGNLGIRPIAIAAQAAHDLEVPLMVHVGNYPPALGDVIDVLHQGDIITHTFHGKPGGVLKANGTPIEQAILGRARGVRFDVGHGVESFSFDTYRRALAAGFDCDSISTDLHVENYQGPVFDLATTVTKLIACGEPLVGAIAKVTSAPAAFFGLEGLGQLAPGMTADVNVFRYDDVDVTLQDATCATVEVKHHVNVRKTIYSREGRSQVMEHPDVPWDPKAVTAEELAARIAEAKKEN